ncbi:insulinase family protein [Mucilaginibacter sp. RS28]|uniref:Insulinase family protein n=1 Tax=Mucilaginibacter straminoryzae TaxID=2932774 RepID=A0A9X1X468_9SPHI|nr:pitrilysin family protein [Mucilaginibacter straminoryzae]MCJ8209353.1 insulinase family protein [Mucilaginibacter straminoryzae]
MRIKLLILFCLFALGAVAQSKLPSNMFFKTLPNGLDVLVIEDNSVPLATVMITCKNGSFTEPPQFNGLSHLYEHMFFKANKDYPTQEDLMNRISELGIEFNGSTTFENVNYYFTLPSANLKPGLELMNSAIRYPLFTPEEMAKENIVVDDEFQRHESSPAFALLQTMDHHMWGDLYSRKNPTGDHQVIRSATPAMMDSIKNKYYYPNNSLLTIAGDVAHDAVFAQVEQLFGSWKHSSFDPFQKWPIPEFKPLTKNDYFVVKSNLTNVPIIQMNWFGPDTRNDIPATYAADVFSYILDQNSSKLSKALIQSGLALQVDFGYLTLRYTGPITLTVIPNPNKVQECLAEIKRQIAMWDSPDYVTDEQLETAKRKLEIKQIREAEVTSDFTQVLSFWWASASIDYFNTYNDNLKKMTKADLQNYVRKYIKDKPHCAGLLINPYMEQQIMPEKFFTASN